MTSTRDHSSANNSYVGRFAPSPTGPLHFGSLLAALVSFIEAKQHNGQWLIRIEDLDPPREMPGADTLILKALESYGFEWDGKVVYQSHLNDTYQAALDQLISRQLAFPCSCSRKQLAATQGLHLSICTPPVSDTPYAWRFQCPHTNLEWHDQLQGIQTIDLLNEVGDFVIKRKELLWAYQLAVIVDDHQQGITDVVRGIDILDSTAKQILLQQALGYNTPSYMHIPVACAANGQKLSKQNHAPALDLEQPETTLWLALQWLGLNPPAELKHEKVHTQLNWGIEHWDASSLQGVTEMPAPII